MTTRTNITFTDKMYEALHQLADERGQPISYLVREAVALYLERSNIRLVDIHPGWGGRRGDDQGPS